MVTAFRLAEGQTQSIKLQEQMDKNIPSDNTVLPATHVGLQNKIKSPQEILKVRSVVLQKDPAQTKENEKPNLQEVILTW